MKHKFSEKASTSDYVKKSKKRKRKSSESSDSEHEKRKKRKKKRSKKSSESDNSRDERKKKHIRKKHQKKSEKSEATADYCDVPISLMDISKKMVPMTKEEWEKKQNVVKRVFDESTGRSRLIKGDGEIIEEIVSRDRHKDINQQTTKGDGLYFQSQCNLKFK